MKFNSSRRMRNFAALVWLLPGLFLVGCSGEGDPAVTAPTGSTSTPVVTLTMESPTLPTLTINGMWVFDTGRLAVCGEQGLVAISDRGAWRTLDTGTDLYLYALWGRSLRDFYVVGEQGCVLHWDGNAFTAIDIGTDKRLYDVWGAGPDDVWICGSSIVINVVGPNVTTFTDSTGLPFNSALYGIGGTASDDVYAVGSGGKIAHWDGAIWQEIDSGLPRGTLNSVYAVESSVFVAADDAHLWRFDGSNWIETVPVVSSADFEVVRGTAPDAVYAFGRSGLMYHWDGSAWSNIAGGFPFDPPEVFCAGVYDGVYVGGRYIDDVNVAYLRSSWSSLSGRKATSEDLNDVWTFEADDAFAVGYEGTIVERTASGWQVVNHGLTTQALRGAWASSSDNRFAVGDDGMVLRYDGASWAVVNTGLGNASLKDIHGNSADNIWILGDVALWHWDGIAWTDRWSELPDPVAVHECIYVAPDNSVFLANENLLRFDGSTWTKFQLKTDEDAYDMWGTSSNNIWIVTDDRAGRWDGNDFSTHMAQYYHFSVTGSGEDNVLVSGEYHIIHFVDGFPTQVPSMHNRDLNGASMGSDGTTYFVGDDGTIVRAE